MEAHRVIGNRFEIGDLERDLLGRGGMGDVYRGRDLQTGEAVAIKALRPEVVAADSDVVARFRREGEALRELDHHNIVKMVEAVEEDGRHYLVMEYVPGGSLRDLLEEQGRLSIQRTVEIALDVADALTRAHRLGIVHRDLKPSNVLLAEDGTPRLTDFGHAHLAASPRLTQTGTVLGTVLYLSPEACRGETLDARADIWAFGATLYEMLSGEVPFGGETFPAVFMAILSQPTPDLSQVRPDVPDALADLVYRMLEKDRGRRVPSVRLVGAELEAILAAVRGERPAVSYQVLPTTSRFATPTPPTEELKHNLPVQPTPFVGRERELAELDRLLCDPEVRLVTVLGPGGIGKTRLGLEAAAAQVARYPDGVWFVSLAPVRSAEAIVTAAAQALGVSFYGGTPLRRQLLAYLRGKRLLLVLDNLEHLLEGVDLLAELLGSAPGVDILATSRARLNLRGEQAFTLSGMDYPQGSDGAARGEDLRRYSSLVLFERSARRTQPGFELGDENLPHVTRICQLTQGIPLAILLAAAWVPVLGPAEIATEVERSLDFLAAEWGDEPERHHSMRAVFDSTWAMLGEGERWAFARLSVFRGGFTREAAQAVAGLDLRTLMSLVNKSLLQRTLSGRYEIHELLRQYGEGKLNERPAERKKVLDLHCATYTEFLRRRETDLWKGYLQEALLEIDNVRAAWRRATLHRRVDQIHGCLFSLFWLYQGPGLLQEGEGIYAEAVDALRPRGAEELDEEREAALGLALMLQGFFASWVGHLDKAQELVETSLPILHRLPPRREVTLGYQLATYLIPMDTSEAVRLNEESLAIAREMGYRLLMPRSLWILATFALFQGAYGQAEGYSREALRVSRENDSPTDIAYALAFCGHSACARGEYARARQCYDEALALFREIGQTWAVGRMLSHLGDVALAVGDYEEARERHQGALAAYRDVGVYWAEAWAIIGGCWGVPISLQRLGNIALATRENREARERYRRALEVAIDDPHLELRLHVTLGPARLLARGGQVERAVEVAALARHHPVSVEETREKAGALLDELRTELPPEAYVAAEERGRARDVEATVEELLAELGGGCQAAR